MLLIAVQAYAAETGCSTCSNGTGTVTVPDKAKTLAQDSPKGGFMIEKKAREKISLGDVLTVELILTNNYASNLSVNLKEYIGGAEVVDAGGFTRSTPKGSPIPPYYKQTVKLAPNSQTTITYSIKPLYHGTLILPEAEVLTPMGEYASNMLVLDVECNKNGLCEKDLDENAFTCPQDCPADKPDGLCNSRKDSVCDPDCNGGDPDCGHTTATSAPKAPTTTLTSLCGNGVCNQPQENHASCPSDCPSGKKDGYCDNVEDSLCDPDCADSEDIDCRGSNSAALVITALFIAAVVLLFAYKKGWLKRGD